MSYKLEITIHQIRNFIFYIKSTVRPEDNLRPEGQFYTPEKTAFRPAERPQQIRPEDNLRPEGKFERPVKESYRSADIPQAG